MYRIFAVLALTALVSCRTPDVAAPLGAPASSSAYTSVVYDLPLQVVQTKAKGLQLVTLTWDAALVRTDSVVIQRQNQSVQPVFVVVVRPNTGVFVDTLPKGKQGTGYYYDLCEYPYPDEVHCSAY